MQQNDSLADGCRHPLNANSPTCVSRHDGELASSWLPARAGTRASERVAVSESPATARVRHRRHIEPPCHREFSGAPGAWHAVARRRFRSQFRSNFVLCYGAMHAYMYRDKHVPGRASSCTRVYTQVPGYAVPKNPSTIMYFAKYHRYFKSTRV